MKLLTILKKLCLVVLLSGLFVPTTQPLSFFGYDVSKTFTAPFTGFFGCAATILGYNWWQKRAERAQWRKAWADLIGDIKKRDERWIKEKERKEKQSAAIARAWTNLIGDTQRRVQS